MKKKQKQTVEEWAWSIDPKTVKSPVIARILEELKEEEPGQRRYNRYHQRHNRS